MRARTCKYVLRMNATDFSTTDGQTKNSFHLRFAVGLGHSLKKSLTLIHVFLQIRQTYWWLCSIDIWHK
jgi:hypothetical protein